MTRNRCASCDSKLPPEGGVDIRLHGGPTDEPVECCGDCVAQPRIAVVGCGASKQDLDDGETVAAKNLYDSTYFAKKRAFAETCCDRWRIVSAEHGLLSPETGIESYDASVNPQSDAYVGDYERGRWSVRTAREIRSWLSFQAVHCRVVVLLGETYLTNDIEAALDSRGHVEHPFRSDDLAGIGDQMQWLDEQVADWQPPGQAEMDQYAADGGQR